MFEFKNITSCKTRNNYTVIKKCCYIKCIAAAIIQAILVLVVLLLPSFLPSLHTVTASALLRRIELLEEAGLQYDRKGRKDKER
jgi:hypothetical protein